MRIGGDMQIKFELIRLVFKNTEFRKFKKDLKKMPSDTKAFVEFATEHLMKSLKLSKDYNITTNELKMLSIQENNGSSNRCSKENHHIFKTRERMDFPLSVPKIKKSKKIKKTERAPFKQGNDRL